MAEITLSIPLNWKLPINVSCCSQVILCLNASWRDKTISGSNLVVATLNNNIRELSSKEFSQGRCAPRYLYSVTIDLAQFGQDPETRATYIPDCSDILDVMPYACTIQSLLHSISPSADENNAIILGEDYGLFACADSNLTDAVADSASDVVDIHLAGTYVAITGSLLTITNGNPCRDMRVMLVGDNTLQATLLATGVFQAIVEQSIDGGAYTTIASASYSSAADITMPLVLPTFDVRTIASGDTLTIRHRLSIITSVGTAAGSQLTAENVGIRAICVSE